MILHCVKVHVKGIMNIYIYDKEVGIGRAWHEHIITLLIVLKAKV